MASGAVKRVGRFCWDMLGAERIGRTTFGLRECEIEEASQIPSLPERPSPPTSTD
jgi:hypothetical protein